MNWIRIDGLHPFDGRYALDTDSRELTTREWGWVKRYSGYLPLTIGDGIEGGDAELFAVFALIAVRRAGKLEREEIPGFMDRILDAGFGTTIVFESDDEPEEADAGPPVISSSSNTRSSGDASQTSSESPDRNPSPTGIPASDISQLAPTRWAS